MSDGGESLVQCQGLGALRPNTVLLGWPTDTQRAEAFAAMLRTLAALGASLVAVRFADEPDDPWAVPDGMMKTGPFEVPLPRKVLRVKVLLY